MKKILLLICTLVMVYAGYSQTLGPLKMKTFYFNNQPEEKKVDLKHFKLSSGQTTGSGTILLLTPDINLNFAKIQKVGDNWTFKGALTPGASYNFVIGEGIRNSDGSTTVNPYWSIGAFADGGIITTSEGSLIASFDVGLCMGIYKYISIAGGFDVLNKNPYLAIGGKISVFTFRQGSGATILKF